jgi:hypothetical protein
MVRRQQTPGGAPTPLIPPAHPRFIADVMLGKLAKWLRVLGYDVLYSNRFTDEEIVRLAEEEDRIILTRDTRLIERRRVRRYLLIHSDHYPEQLRQVVRTFDLDPHAGLFTRCVHCNGELVLVPKAEVVHEVPLYTFRTRDLFARCRRCGHVYWRGTHWTRMQHKLERMLGEMGLGRTEEGEA